MWEAVQEKSRRMVNVAIVLAVLVFLLYYNWIYEAQKCAHIMPDTEWVDISGIVGKANWSESEKELLLEQTGLGRRALEAIKLQNREKELPGMQQIYFASVQIETIHTTFLTVSEWLVDAEGFATKGMPIVDVKDGDILVTKNSRFLGWRNGHAGLVIDAKEGLVLEALMPGTDSQLCSLEKWESYPSFMVLRLWPEDETAAATTKYAREIVAYAMEELVGIPYQLLTGVFGWYEPDDDSIEEAGQKQRKLENPGIEPVGIVPENSELKGTQCAHLVWYAYYLAGIDLDSDGGVLVTPEDIRNSPYLEVIQSYGY